MAGAAWHAAAAAVDEGEGTQRETVFGASGGHGSLQEEDLILGFWGRSSRRRDVVLYETSIAKE
jgi:hypothetical protein